MDTLPPDLPREADTIVIGPAAAEPPSRAL